MAYKQLSRTQHIDPGLLAAVKGAVRPAGPPGSQVAPPTGVPPGPPPSSTPSGPATPAPSGPESRPGTAPPPNGEVKTESTEESSATKEEVKSEPSQEPSTPAPPEGAEEPKDGETPKAIWTEKEEPPVERGTDLAELLRDKRPGYGQHKITPIQKPKGIDPRNGSVLLHSNVSQIECCIFICNPSNSI